MESVITEHILAGGGVAASIIVLLMMLIKVYAAFNRERMVVVRSNAEESVIDSLKDELERLKVQVTENIREIRELKVSHERERMELLTRIQNLENVLREMKELNQRVRKDVVRLLNDIKRDPEYKQDDKLDMFASILERIIYQIDSGKQEVILN